MKREQKKYSLHDFDIFLEQKRWKTFARTEKI